MTRRVLPRLPCATCVKTGTVELLCKKISTTIRFHYILTVQVAPDCGVRVASSQRLEVETPTHQSSRPHRFLAHAALHEKRVVAKLRVELVHLGPDIVPDPIPGVGVPETDP